MTLLIKRIDTTLPLPEYHTSGSVAFDLYARTDYTIFPKEVARIPGNFIIQVPKEHMLVVVPRSSTPMRLGLSIPQGIGIVDQDYCGPEDEIKLQVFNFTNQPVEVKRGDRIAQAVLIPIIKVIFKEVEEISPVSRGGFGSTGL